MLAITRIPILRPKVGANIGKNPPIKHIIIPIRHKFFLPTFDAIAPPIIFAIIPPTTGKVTNICKYQVGASGNSLAKSPNRHPPTDTLARSSDNDNTATWKTLNLPPVKFLFLFIFFIPFFLLQSYCTYSFHLPLSVL